MSEQKLDEESVDEQGLQAEIVHESEVSEFQEVIFDEADKGSFQNSFHYRTQFNNRQKSNRFCCGLCLLILISVVSLFGFAIYGLYRVLFNQ